MALGVVEGAKLRGSLAVLGDLGNEKLKEIKTLNWIDI